METLAYLSKSEYLAITKDFEGEHWTPATIESRWDYHYRTIELIKSLNPSCNSSVLEMGTMGVSCVKNSDTIDYAERWDFPGKKPTYFHDARKFPWPIDTKKYEIFVALRVYQHLTPVQKECVVEAFRIAKKVIIVVPDKYQNHVLPSSEGISYSDFYDFLGCIHPNLFVPTAQGNLFYWDTENPSHLNIEYVMYQLQLFKYQTVHHYNVISKCKSFVRKLIQR